MCSVTRVSVERDRSLTKETIYLTQIVLEKVNDAWQSIKNIFFTLTNTIRSLLGKVCPMTENSRSNEKDPEAPNEKEEEKKSDSGWSSSSLYTFYEGETPETNSKFMRKRFRFIGLES